MKENNNLNIGWAPIRQIKQCCPCDTGRAHISIQQIISNSQALRMYDNYKKTYKANRPKISLKKQIKENKEIKESAKSSSFKITHSQNSTQKQEDKVKQSVLCFKNILAQIHQEEALNSNRVVSYDEFKSGLQKSESMNSFKFSSNIKNFDDQINQIFSKNFKQKDVLKTNKRNTISTNCLRSPLNTFKKSLSHQKLHVYNKLEDQNHWLFGQNSIKQTENMLDEISDSQRRKVKSKLELDSAILQTNVKSLKHSNQNKSENAMGTSNSLNYLSSLPRVLSQKQLLARTSLKKNISKKQLLVQGIAEQQEFRLRINSPKLFMINKSEFESQRFFPSKPKINRTISFSSISDLPQNSNSIASIRKNNFSNAKTSKADLLQDQCIQSSFQFCDLSQPKQSQAFNQNNNGKDQKSRNPNWASFSRIKPNNFFYSVNLKKKQLDRKLQNMIRMPVQSIAQPEQRDNSEVLTSYQDYLKLQQHKSVADSVLQSFKMYKYANFDVNRLSRNESLPYMLAENQ